MIEEDDGFQSSRFIVRYFDCVMFILCVYSSEINLNNFTKTKNTVSAIVAEIVSFCKTLVFYLTFISKSISKRDFFTIPYLFIFPKSLRRNWKFWVIYPCVGRNVFFVNKYVVAGLASKLGSKDCSMNLANPPLMRWRFDLYIYPFAYDSFIESL